MKRIIKLKAYTVIELIVVMIISAIVIVMAYTCYNIISKQYRMYSQLNKETEQLVLMERLIRSDFSKAKVVQLSDRGFDCLMTEKLVHYVFEEDYIIRNDIITDTFYISSVVPKMSFRYEDQFVPGSIIDYLHMEYLVRDIPLFLICKKSYGADILMEYKGDN